MESIWNFDPALGYTAPIGDPWASGAIPSGAALGDVPQTIAAGLAEKGIRPSQFTSKALKILPPGAADSNAQSREPWDPTPEQGPGPPSQMPRPDQVPGRTGLPITPAEASASTQTPANMAATATTDERVGNFLKALSGVKMPTPPVAQRVETPRPVDPRVTAQKLNPQLIQYLAALNTAKKAPPVLALR
jgi:hypothetical protein